MSDFRPLVRAALEAVPPPDHRGARLSVAPELAPLVLARLPAVRPAAGTMVVTATMAEADALAAELQHWLTLLGLTPPVYLLPELEPAPRQVIPEHECERSRLLQLAGGQPAIFVGSALAVLAPAPPPARFRDRYRTLRCGSREHPPQRLAQFLTELDYDNEAAVHLPGEFSWRGGILDVFSPVHEYPVRLEYAGDALESLRFFDPETQRSVREIADCLIIPRGETALRGPPAAEYFTFLDYFPAGGVQLVLCQPPRLGAHVDRFGTPAQAARYRDLGDGRLPLLVLDDVPDPETTGAAFPGQPLTALFATAAAPELEAGRNVLLKQLLHGTVKRWRATGYTLAVCGASQGALDRMLEILHADPELRDYRPALATAGLRTGVFLPLQQLAILTETEVFGRDQVPLPRRRPRAAFHVDHLWHGTAELAEGDYVVHAAYGIGKYRGLRLATFNGQPQEVLTLEFAADVEVQVPLDQAYLVARYVGAAKQLPPLSKVGAAGWKIARGKAQAAVTDLAAELLRLQAVRATAPGVALDGDRAALAGFAEAFPYAETEDQRRAIADVEADMMRPRPMDRLLCGDVGFGKTEVAMRAAFRAVLAGRQVAVLVPTTVLCQQHYLSFQDRFKEHPVLIEELSRFRTPGAQRRILDDLAAGKLDIVIGTHRLLTADVKFRDLGLVIVDEEQRFGVRHKERLKHLRANVDVLTMTATPIPRTLYYSMAGLRDLSTIATPPLERLPVQTVVAQYSDDLVREAIRRELQRGGQVFYLHNRVETIGQVATRLQRLVPAARCAIGHGQLPESDLERVMLAFMRGTTDVLVCTTIIESGLDIPNANTIVIERADRFGLAELYQLRGRVGRYHRQAYAYLLIPPHGLLLDTARQRLGAIRKYTQLGTGFRIALRDLEIRGAGNLLGHEQSGHISAIGFDLYCQLLKEAVSRLQGRPSPRRPEVSLLAGFISFGPAAGPGQLAASLPRDYITDETLRVACYRRLSGLQTAAEVAAYADELRDRFGPLPPPAQHFLTVSRLKLAAAAAGIHAIGVRDHRVYLETGSGFIKEPDGRLPVLAAREPGACLAELEALVQRHARRAAAT